jgi:hypothetical protein
MGRRSLRPSVVTGGGRSPQAPVAGRERAPRGEQLRRVVTFGVSAVASCLAGSGHRGGALGVAAHRPDAHRRHRSPRPPWRPGDPPAPLSFPRCPGHHQPSRHPDHDGAPHAARLAATARPGELERALAQAERLQLYGHRAIQDVIARSNGHRGTKVLTQATAREAKWTHNEWEAAFLQLLRKAGIPEPLVNAAFRSDRAKDAALTASGYRVLRFTKDVEPELVVRRLRALLV